MKKQILFATLLLMGCSAVAQTKVIQDAKGNYQAVSRDTAKPVNKPTGKTYTDKDGQVYPVYISTRGKLYYLRTSQSGRVYKSYINI